MKNQIAEIIATDREIRKDIRRAVIKSYAVLRNLPQAIIDAPTVKDYRKDEETIRNTAKQIYDEAFEKFLSSLKRVEVKDEQ
jgi:uncharacterized membrane-anchored protein YjiN (DUF445 family)